MYRQFCFNHDLKLNNDTVEIPPKDRLTLKEAASPPIGHTLGVASPYYKSTFDPRLTLLDLKRNKNPSCVIIILCPHKMFRNLPVSYLDK
jgi:hypothetical protein